MWRQGTALMRADFAETLGTAAAIGGVDLVFTSPPYCDARTYNAGINFGFADYQRLGDAVFGALAPGGHCLLNVDAPVRKWRKGFGSERGLMPWRIMLDWAERVGFRVPDRLAFGRFGTPGEYRGRFRNDWEPLFWFQKPGGKGYFNKIEIAKPAVSGDYTGHRTPSRKRDGSKRSKRATSGKCAEQGLRQPGTFWDYGNVGRLNSGCAELEAAKHPARFPYRLAEDVIRCFAPPGGLVCDPFMGAGTVLIAAKRRGCHFIGGDLGERKDGRAWIDVAAEVADRVLCEGK